jgi:hypothetical protein
MLGDTVSPHKTLMLNEGSGLALGADELRQAMADRGEIRALMMRYVLIFHEQVAHTALSNAVSTVEERVARWLLMTYDRVLAD